MDKLHKISFAELDDFATSRRVTSESGANTEDDTDIEITPEFARGLELVDSGSPVIYLTGKAGTGKSTFVKYLRKIYQKNLAIVAPTGVAALNAGGMTIHSFCHFPARPIARDEVKKIQGTRLYEELDLLIIDEVSMVRADLLDAVDAFLRKNRKDYQHAFGGVQLLLVGDLFQLPPVVARTDEARLFGNGAMYQSEFFFSAHSLRQSNCQFVELTKIYRQDCNSFVALLNAVREAESVPQAVDYLNTDCRSGVNGDQNVITLTCTKKLAGDINASRLKQIDGEEFTFMGHVYGKFDVDRDHLPAPYKLMLRIGAQVMFTKNNVEKHWVNGTLGTVIGVVANFIQVEVVRGDERVSYDVEKAEWEALAYEFDSKSHKVKAKKIGVYTQYPLMLAWAITIHKSQGKTIDHINIDLGSGAFAHGQVYVALSRCPTLQGITMKRKIREHDIKCDPRVKRFHQMLRDGD